MSIPLSCESVEFSQLLRNNSRHSNTSGGCKDIKALTYHRLKCYKMRCPIWCFKSTFDLITEILKKVVSEGWLAGEACTCNYLLAMDVFHSK